jgi:hypothetical protein
MRSHRAALLVPLALAACQTAQPGVRGENAPSTTRIAGGTANSQVLYEFTTRADTRVVADAVPAPADRVWRVLPAVYQELGLAVTRADEDHRLLGSQQAVPRTKRILGMRMSELLQCGRTPLGLPAADAYDVTLIVATDVLTAGRESSTIRSVVEGRARDPVSSSTPANCTSTGKLERAIADDAVLRTRG